MMKQRLAIERGLLNTHILHIHTFSWSIAFYLLLNDFIETYFFNKKVFAGVLEYNFIVEKFNSEDELKFWGVQQGTQLHFDC